MDGLYQIKEIKLFDKAADCCGCGACASACKRQAITLEADEYGFYYPAVDAKKCTGCGLCNRSCRFQNGKEVNVPLAAYAAMSCNKNRIMNSASGGVFAELATLVLENGGTVFGASMEFEYAGLTPKHIAVNHKEQLIKLQGSKYVQSFIGNTYLKARELLHKGQTVLFTGTPCQIAGLKGFLGKEYPNLITMDLICHGVPSAGFFRDYVNLLEKRLKGRVKNFVFRTKAFGWGRMVGKVSFTGKQGKVKEKLIHNRLSSYYKYFLNADVYRDSCYSCPYASSHRPADITVGDYWGIRKAHPELLDDSKFREQMQYGVSCAIANTEKGRIYLEKLKKTMKLHESSFDKVAEGNDQLNHPSEKGRDRDIILGLYSKGGYKAVEKYFRKQEKLKRYLTGLKFFAKTLLKGIR